MKKLTVTLDGKVFDVDKFNAKEIWTSNAAYYNCSIRDARRGFARDMAQGNVHDREVIANGKRYNLIWFDCGYPEDGYLVTGRTYNAISKERNS